MKSIITFLLMCSFFCGQSQNPYRSYRSTTPAAKAPAAPKATKSGYMSKTQNNVDIPKSAGTTQEEYNYVTRGYEIQTKSGLDMKKGYSMKDIEIGKYADYEIEIKALYRDGDTTPCAILLILQYKSSIQCGLPKYFCVPHWKSSDEIWEQSDEDSQTMEIKFERAIRWAALRAASYFSQQ